MAPDLLAELERSPERSARFTRLLNQITQLTHQLEQRYRGFLPYSLNVTPLELPRPPACACAATRRKSCGSTTTATSAKCRTARPAPRHARRLVCAQQTSPQGCTRSSRTSSPAGSLVSPCAPPPGYHDILQRIVITPRIHQGMITSREQFAIETTAFNMQEINAIAGKYGNPARLWPCRSAFPPAPEALIALDRKMNAQHERFRREYPEADLPGIWLIRLSMDIEAVEGIPDYLTKQGITPTRPARPGKPRKAALPGCSAKSSSPVRFDQQISQPHSAFQYVKAKYRVYTWLAEHGLADSIRIKLGSGEPMQRQGGYYAPVSGQPAFPHPERHRKRLAKNLPPPRSAAPPTPSRPCRGSSGGDLRHPAKQHLGADALPARL